MKLCERCGTVISLRPCKQTQCVTCRHTSTPEQIAARYQQIKERDEQAYYKGLRWHQRAAQRQNAESRVKHFLSSIESENVSS